jgi:hypothetical protein
MPMQAQSPIEQVKLHLAAAAEVRQRFQIARAAIARAKKSIKRAAAATAQLEELRRKRIEILARNSWELTGSPEVEEINRTIAEAEAWAPALRSKAEAAQAALPELERAAEEVF